MSVLWWCCALRHVAETWHADHTEFQEPKHFRNVPRTVPVDCQVEPYNTRRLFILRLRPTSDLTPRLAFEADGDERKLNGDYLRAPTSTHEYSECFYLTLRQTDAMYRSIVTSMSLWLFVCLSVCRSARIYLRKNTAELYQLFYTFTLYGRGSVSLWQSCDTLCTSGFYWWSHVYT